MKINISQSSNLAKVTYIHRYTCGNIWTGRLICYSGSRPAWNGKAPPCPGGSESTQAIIHTHTERNVGINRRCSMLPMSLEDINILSPKLFNTTCGQLGTFFFGDYDTTSTTIT